MNTSFASPFQLGVKVGGKDLVTSGTIHFQEPEFELKVDNLIIAFCFKTDDGNSRYEGRIEGTHKLIMDLYNHNNPMTNGVFSPLEIGAVRGRKLYITYVTALVDDDNKRRFEFALYLGDS